MITRAVSWWIKPSISRISGRLYAYVTWGGNAFGSVISRQGFGPVRHPSPMLRLKIALRMERSL
jgi:hypothetical protein